MDFNKNQIKQDLLIKDGRYKFHVLDAREKRSASGNDMINLKLSLDFESRKVVYWAKLILMPKMFWLIEHFCQATGMPEKIDEGRLMAQDCQGKEGYIDIVTKVNQETGEFENQTKDFVKPENLTETEKAHLDLDSEDVPDFR